LVAAIFSKFLTCASKVFTRLANVTVASPVLSVSQLFLMRLYGAFVLADFSCRLRER
jgi:hypothetical protein